MPTTFLPALTENSIAGHLCQWGMAFSAQHVPCLFQGEWSETTGCGDSGRGEEDIDITIFKRKSFKAKNLAGGGRFLHYKYPWPPGKINL